MCIYMGKYIYIYFLALLKGPRRSDPPIAAIMYSECPDLSSKYHYLNILKEMAYSRGWTSCSAGK